MKAGVLGPKLGIFGWYGRGNCGDEAFKDAFNILLPNSIKEYKCGIPECEVLILGGGDVIKPYYLDHVGEREFFILGAGLGYESELDLLRGKNVKKLLLRNRRDAALAVARGFNAAYCPDLAFAITPPAKAIPSHRKRAVVILNDAINPSFGKREKASEMAYAEYFKWELAEALSCLSEWYDFTFVPFSSERYNMDIKCHYDVVHRMERPGNSAVLMTAPTPAEALSYISKADLVITMKFHGVIFATLSCTPFVNIGLSRKTQQFCQEEGLGELSIPAYSFTKDTFLESVKIAEEIDCDYLAGVTEHNKELLLRSFKKLEEELCT